MIESYVELRVSDSVGRTWWCELVIGEDGWNIRTARIRDDPEGQTALELVSTSADTPTALAERLRAATQGLIAAR